MHPIIPACVLATGVFFAVYEVPPAAAVPEPFGGGRRFWHIARYAVPAFFAFCVALSWTIARCIASKRCRTVITLVTALLVAATTCVLTYLPYADLGDDVLRRVWNDAVSDDPAGVCAYMQQQQCVGWTAPCGAASNTSCGPGVSVTAVGSPSHDGAALCPSSCDTSVGQVQTAVLASTGVVACRDLLARDVANWTKWRDFAALGACALTTLAFIVAAKCGAKCRPGARDYGGINDEDDDDYHWYNEGSSAAKSTLSKCGRACLLIAGVLLSAVAPAALVAFVHIHEDLVDVDPLFAVRGSPAVASVSNASIPYSATFETRIGGGQASDVRYDWALSVSSGPWTSVASNGPNATVTVPNCTTPASARVRITSSRSPSQYELIMNATCVAMSAAVTLIPDLSQSWRFVNCSVTDGNATQLIIESYRFGTQLPANLRAGFQIAGVSPEAWRQWMNPETQQPCFAWHHKIVTVSSAPLTNGAIRATMSLTESPAVDALAAAHVHLADVTATSFQTLSVPLPSGTPISADVLAASQRSVRAVAPPPTAPSLRSMFFQTVKVHEGITLGNGIVGSVGVTTQGTLGSLGASLTLSLHVPVSISKDPVSGAATFSAAVEGSIDATISAGIAVDDTVTKTETTVLYEHSLFGCDVRWCGFFLGDLPVRMRPSIKVDFTTSVDASLGFATSGSITAGLQGSAKASYTMGAGALQHSGSWGPTFSHKFDPPHFTHCSGNFAVTLPVTVTMRLDGLLSVSAVATPGFDLQVAQKAEPSCPGIYAPLLGTATVTVGGGLTPSFLRALSFSAELLEYSYTLHGFCVGTSHCNTYYSCTTGFECVVDQLAGTMTQSMCEQTCSDTFSIQGWKDPGLLEFGCNNAPDGTFTYKSGACENAVSSGKVVGSFKLSIGGRGASNQYYTMTYYTSGGCPASQAQDMGDFEYGDCVHRPYLNGQYWSFPYWIVTMQQSSASLLMMSAANRSVASEQNQAQLPSPPPSPAQALASVVAQSRVSPSSPSMQQQQP